MTVQNSSRKKQDVSAEKSIDYKEMLKNPMNWLFLIFSTVTLGGAIPFTKACFDITQRQSMAKPDGYEYPQLSDFGITLISSAIFTSLEWLFQHKFYHFCIPHCKEQKDIEQRNVRSGKMAQCFYCVVYFLFATMWGFYVISDQYYMPKALGGKGDFKLMMKEYPYAKHAPGLKEYLLVTMGYHVGGLVNHFVSVRRNDFFEMALHHIVALYLFGGCYMFNLWEGGAVVAFLHDIADIGGNLTKTLTQTNYDSATAVVFVSTMGVWFYTRCYLLAIFIYQIWTMEYEFGSPIVRPFFCYLLGCMYVLHCYWFQIFCKLLKKYAMTGETEDTQNKIEFKKVKEIDVKKKDE